MHSFFIRMPAQEKLGTSNNNSVNSTLAYYQYAKSPWQKLRGKGENTSPLIIKHQEKKASLQNDTEFFYWLTQGF